jgi:hypothetical protein
MEKLLGGGMRGKEAAATPGITERRLRRLKVKCSKERKIGLIHGNRGRKPAISLPEDRYAAMGIGEIISNLRNTTGLAKGSAKPVICANFTKEDTFRRGINPFFADFFPEY